MRLALFVLITSGSWAQPQIKALIDLPGTSGSPSLSPDGQTLAFQHCEPEYRACGIYTRPYAGGEVQLLIGGRAEVPLEGFPDDPRWSPDGKQIAFIRVYARYEARLFIFDLVTNMERSLGSACAEASSFGWSPNGRYLALSVYTGEPSVSFNCGIVLVAASNGVRRLLSPTGTAPAFSPDGRTLAYADGFVLKTIRLSSAYQPLGPPQALVREPRPISQVQWSLDDKQIVYQAWGDVPYVRRISIVPGAKPRPIPGVPNGLSIHQILPNGDALGMDAGFSETSHWRVDLRASPPKPERVVSAPCTERPPECSPDGRKRIFFSTETGVSQLWVTDADGANRRLLLAATPPMSDASDYSFPDPPRWAPDGRLIAFTVHSHLGYGDNRAHLYLILSEGGPPRRLGKDFHSLSDPVWSRDGKSLYCVAERVIDGRMTEPLDSVVRVDVATGKVTAVGEAGSQPQLSPDGAWLYFMTFPPPRLMRVRLTGGPSELLSEDKRLAFRYAVGDSYVCMFEFENDEAKLLLLDPNTKKSEQLAIVPRPATGARLSPDGRFLYFDHFETAAQRAISITGLVPR